MKNWNQTDMLEVVELFAEDNGMIASEEELSERFDSDVLPHIIEQYGEDDEPAIMQGFADWCDSLCRDGEIHPEQDRNYCYVGRLAD